jgi:hypothetical protein
MPYKKITSGDSAIFEIEPEVAPSFLKSSIWLLILPILLLWGISVAIGFIVTALLGIWIYFIQKNKNVTKGRERMEFTVRENGIQFGNKFYDKEDIHRIIIRNHMNEKYLYISAEMSRKSPMATQQGLKLREKLIAVSYRVDIEYKGNAITVAGGLTEPTAFAIYSDMSKILNFKSN